MKKTLILTLFAAFVAGVIGLNSADRNLADLPSQHSQSGTTIADLPSQHSQSGTTIADLPSQHSQSGTIVADLPSQHDYNEVFV
ncbi:hypothetical protein G3A_17905 [Bacillus sp. 17376]|uniref:Uncharacterized protein n=1 Tax=Mesobacillus boroniphilus JCM 21738 TaxID=1294265 RepID=W4RL23_9BACI|nr:hypothetical protein [Mesobacillus boroniphilus]ESU31254.1 hypothetical protein G3A_17905 [Bacillus sp. 17376]GAE44573.1 hypothetical protein JCM21738_1295 [Mesobacillus boroniphilus JCM 21738]